MSENLVISYYSALMAYATMPMLENMYIYAYLRTRLACLTRFSITPSKASLSPSALSLRFSQYSSTSLALVVSSSNCFACARNSSSVMFDNAASVVVHSIFVACKSSAGAGAGPFRRLLFVVVPGLSMEVDDALSCFRRTREPVLCPLEERESLRRCTEGSMSFFCFDAGRISSRSTGTPKDTRKSRRILERTQFGG